MIEYTGATPVPVPLRSDRAFVLDHQAVLELISPRTRLIIVNSPANPTGAVTPQFELEHIPSASNRGDSQRSADEGVWRP
jgi:aspartate/methionine/tyrosine aminotransferase